LSSHYTKKYGSRGRCLF